jgi:hypothetical protein
MAAAANGIHHEQHVEVKESASSTDSTYIFVSTYNILFNSLFFIFFFRFPSFPFSSLIVFVNKRL